MLNVLISLIYTKSILNVNIPHIASVIIYRGPLKLEENITTLIGVKATLDENTCGNHHIICLHGDLFPI